jgi:16S rRNA (guanine966-N2)-methyltransferase
MRKESRVESRESGVGHARHRSSREKGSRGRLSTVRISAGRWKGRRLEVPAGVRPTSSRAREALFDILQHRIPGARVLDLCAGSGAVGLEAVSRGAARAVLVERDAEVLERNVERLKPRPGEIRILRSAAGASVGSLGREGELFDLVFADPPYGGRTDFFPRVAPVLAVGGLFVLQRDSGPPAFRQPPGWRLLRRAPYGRNVFDFFTRPPDSP